MDSTEYESIGGEEEHFQEKKTKRRRRSHRKDIKKLGAGAEVERRRKGCEE